MKNLDKITAEMMGYVCDVLCKYPEMEPDEESLAEICDGCWMGEFLCNILSHEGAKINETEKRS